MEDLIGDRSSILRLRVDSEATTVSLSDVTLQKVAKKICCLKECKSEIDITPFLLFSFRGAIPTGRFETCFSLFRISFKRKFSGKTRSEAIPFPVFLY
jgi:hypothetical protein